MATRLLRRRVALAVAVELLLAELQAHQHDIAAGASGIVERQMLSDGIGDAHPVLLLREVDAEGEILLGDDVLRAIGNGDEIGEVAAAELRVSADDDEADGGVDA